MLGYIIIAVLLVCFGVIAFNTMKFKPAALRAGDELRKFDLNYEACIKKSSEAVSIPTISNKDSKKVDWSQFAKYREFLKREFPLVHENMELKIINEHSLLYRWKGTSDKYDPVIITAHIDVVPVEDGTEKDWEYPAFDGHIGEGYLWGRGTLDTKIHMIAALEAAEQALDKGIAPGRDIYFAFGHDEEIGGKEGAQKIVDYLVDQGIHFEYLIDEGGTVTEGLIEGIDNPIALIGIGEKGFANIKISVNGDGGHSSMPPKHTALGKIGKIITCIENNQTKLKLTPPIKELLLRLGPHMSLSKRIILSNLWLFEPLFVRLYAKSKTGNAMLRTTTAVTMAEASVAPNVLPQRASVICNFRLIPGDTCDKLIEHLKDINKGIDLEIEGLRLENPSMISPTDTDSFRLLERKIKAMYPEAIVTPYVVLAGTDARKYEPVCDNIYRFTPYFVDNKEIASIHSTNERISLDNINRCLDFFYGLMVEEDSRYLEKVDNK